MRQIKRYKTRQLYDPVLRQYLSLHDIREAVQKGHDLKVVETATGRDVTTMVFAEVVMKTMCAEKDLHHPLMQLLRERDWSRRKEMLRTILKAPSQAPTKS